MRLLTCLLAAALLAACSRDLDVPEPTTAPRIASFSPSAAFAGEWLTIQGSGFDADPQGNLVQFARASTRAEAVGDGTIGLRVPVDAGSGPFTVTTRGGISAPSATPLAYRGLGELRTRVAASATPMLHKPYRLVATRDDTYLHSDLLLGVVRYGDPEFVAPEAVGIDAVWAGGNGAVLRLDSNGTSSTLVLDQGPMYGTLAKAIAYAGLGPVVAMRTGGGLPESAAVLRVDPDYAASWTVALHQLSDLEPVPSWPSAGQQGVPQPLPGVRDVRGCADTGGGELACLARSSATGPLRLVRIHLPPPLAITWLPATAVPIVENRFLPGDPLCGDSLNRRAIVALTDGSVVTAQLQPVGGDLTPTPYFHAAADTGSRTLVRSIACFGRPNFGTWALLAKPDDDLLVRLQPFGPNPPVDWTVEIPKASQAAVWCNLSDCSNGVIHAAGESDNRVLVLDMFDGKVLARRSFDVLPGRVEAPNALLDRTAMNGAGWYQGAGEPPHLVFATSAPRGVIEWPLTAKRGVGLFPHFRHAPDGLGAFAWVDKLGYVTLREQQFATPAWSVPLDGTARLGVDAPSHVYFGTTAGLEAAGWDGVTHEVSPLSSAEFTSLGLVEDAGVADAHVLAAVRSGGEWRVRLWSRAEALAGSASGRSWLSPGAGARMIAAAAVLDGTLRAFYWDAGGTLHAVGLDGNLVPQGDTALEDLFYSIVAVSPNGRTFVSWDFQPFSQRDTSVVVWSADAATGFARLATIPVEGQVSGAAFDATGEQLYVVTRGPDRIVLVE